MHHKELSSSCSSSSRGSLSAYLHHRDSEIKYFRGCHILLARSLPALCLGWDQERGGGALKTAAEKEISYSCYELVAAAHLTQHWWQVSVPFYPAHYCLRQTYWSQFMFMPAYNPHYLSCLPHSPLAAPISKPNQLVVVFEVVASILVALVSFLT